MLKNLIQIDSFYEEESGLTYDLWMLHSTYLVTSTHGPIKEFATLEEASEFLYNVFSE